MKWGTFVFSTTLVSLTVLLILGGMLLRSRTNAQTLPHISSFTPTSGTLGRRITITGSGFTGASRVAFNRVAAGFSVNSDTQITATVPGGATTGPISVTPLSGVGWSFSGAPFTVNSTGAPGVTSFSPKSGPAGTTVTLTGTSLTGLSGG